MIRVRPQLVVGFVLAIILSAGMWLAQRGSPPSPPNVLMLVVDTLRADQLGAYGARLPTSPRLDQLADEGLRFDQAYAASSWTMPSVASYLTGLLPPSHGVRTETSRLPAKVPLLQESFKKRGYTTVALMGNSNLSRDFGFGRGFDLYLEARKEPKLAKTGLPLYPSAKDMSDVALEALDRLQHTQFFLYVHYMDTHGPYLLPDDGEDLFADPNYQGFMVTRLAQVRPLMGPRYVRVYPYFWSKVQDTEADHTRIRALYDAKVHYVDRHIGRLLDGLEARGLAENTVVVFLSDHGEGLGQHGIREHRESPYQHQVRVPLMVRIPGGSRGVIHSPVELVDLPGALMGLVGGADAPELRQTEGNHTLQAALLDENFVDRVQRTIVSDVNGEPTGIEARMVIDGDWKLMLKNDERYLFNLREDPGELVNRIGSDPDQVQPLLDVLEARLGSYPGTAEGREAAPITDQETLDRLRALGYVQ